MSTLCGCVTVLHPVDNMTREQYFESRILCHKDGFCYDAGIAYGNSENEINKAIHTVSEAKDQFNYLIKLYTKTVDLFIQDVKELINNKLSPKNTVENIYY